MLQEARQKDPITAMARATQDITALVAELRDCLGPAAVLTDERDLQVYSYDATLRRGLPDLVVLPQSTGEIAAVVRACRAHNVPLVPRGSATSLSGGPIPVAGGVVLALTRMNRIIEIDEENMRAVVQPGVINQDLNDALAERGLMYAPDPASQIACTMGGNVAENAGGPHCLKYGVTANHITGLTVVTADGEIVRLGSKAVASGGLDLRGLVIGSEGTLAVVAEIVCRLLPASPARVTMLACFNSIADASAAVSDIIAAGLLPATLEMIDRTVIEAVEAYDAIGYPRDVEAVLVIEIDGLQSALLPQVEQAQEVCLRHSAARFEWADSADQRERLWRGRKGATAALAMLAPAKLSTDVTVPRSRLPEALAEVAEISRRFNIPIGNVFHAGDGNLHPQVLFDPRDQEQMARAIAADEAITEMALRYGGVLTGEHGIGSEKRKHMLRAFGRPELEAMWAVKEAFDPAGILNPSKVLPDRRDVESLAWTRPQALWQISPGRVAVNSAAEAADLLASCAASGWRGNCRAQSRMPTPQEAVDVELTAADVIDYDSENLTVTVAAGMSVGELLEVLGEQRQTIGAWRCLPPETGVGSLVALGWPSPSCVRFGLPRDFVLGVTVATPRGVLRFGSSCVKNAAGYALERLFIGNCGVLGIIVAVTLRTHPLPKHEVTLCRDMSVNELRSVGLWLARQALPVEWFRALYSGAQDHWIAYVHLGGYREEVEEAAEILRERGFAATTAERPILAAPQPVDEVFAIAAPPQTLVATPPPEACELWPIAGLAWTKEASQFHNETFAPLSLSADRVLDQTPLPHVARRLKRFFDPQGVLPPWDRAD
ncbi:MAG: FAD-binding protein [Armatimonadetes bacterium]|nr:FAD-binding protein [Armatimonadota bacterium]